MKHQATFRCHCALTLAFQCLSTWLWQTGVTYIQSWYLQAPLLVRTAINHQYSWTSVSEVLTYIVVRYYLAVLRFICQATYCNLGKELVSLPFFLSSLSSFFPSFPSFLPFLLSFLSFFPFLSFLSLFACFLPSNIPRWGSSSLARWLGEPVLAKRDLWAWSSDFNLDNLRISFP